MRRDHHSTRVNRPCISPRPDHEGCHGHDSSRAGECDVRYTSRSGSGVTAGVDLRRWLHEWSAHLGTESGVTSEFTNGRGRVRHCGTLARSVGAASAVAFLGGTWIASELSDASRPAIVACYCGFAVWLVRALMLGVWVTSDVLIVRTWGWTYKIPIGTLKEVRQRRYDGVHLTFASSQERFRQLEIVTERRAYALPFTVATRKGIARSGSNLLNAIAAVRRPLAS